MVERRVAERQRLGGCLDEIDLGAKPLPGAGEHLGALVDAGHPEPPSHELGGDEPGPGRDVEHMAAGREP